MAPVAKLLDRKLLDVATGSIDFVVTWAIPRILPATVSSNKTSGTYAVWRYPRTNAVQLPISCLPSSLSQFEEAVGHWRGCRCRDGEALVDCFEDKASVETPGEGAEVARQMFGGDHSVGGEQAVLDIGEHRICPAGGRVACGAAIGAGDMALMDDPRLLGNAAKPLAAVADDRRSGHDAGA